MDLHEVSLAPMTEEMYRTFFKDYQHDPDLYLPGQAHVPYTYSEEAVARYVRRQAEKQRIPLAILCDGEIVGEIILKNIEPHRCATMGITLKNASYKDRGIGTRAEKLAVRYVFRELDIPTLYADTVKANSRSQRVLEKVGFTLVGEDRDFKYYRIDQETERQHDPDGTHP